MQSNKIKRQQEQEDWRAVLASDAGQRVTAHLVRMSNVLCPSYAPGDALATAYNEGLRRMGLYIIAEVTAAAPEHRATLLTGQEKKHESDSSGDSAPGGYYTHY